MTFDLAGLPWWAVLLVLLVGGVVGLVLAGALWAVLLWLMFGRWWRALISVALIGVAVWRGVPGLLWQTVDTGWGQSAVVTVAVVVTVVGLPVGLVMLGTGAVSRVGGDRLRRSRPGPATAPLPRTPVADYGSESNQWARELHRRDGS